MRAYSNMDVICVQVYILVCTFHGCGYSNMGIHGCAYANMDVTLHECGYSTKVTASMKCYIHISIIWISVILIWM